MQLRNGFELVYRFPQPTPINETPETVIAGASH